MKKMRMMRNSPKNTLGRTTLQVSSSGSAAGEDVLGVEMEDVGNDDEEILWSLRGSMLLKRLLGRMLDVFLSLLLSFIRCYYWEWAFGYRSTWVN